MIEYVFNMRWLGAGLWKANGCPTAVVTLKLQGYLQCITTSDTTEPSAYFMYISLSSSLSCLQIEALLQSAFLQFSGIVAHFFRHPTPFSLLFTFKLYAVSISAHPGIQFTRKQGCMSA